MAIRRATQKAQVIEKLRAMAPPGDTFIACVHGETGPSPWLSALFDEVPLLGLIVSLTRRFYFFTLTDSHVVVNSANRFTRRPGDVVAVYPRDAFPGSRLKRGAVWSRFYVLSPGASRPSRINVSRYWRSELDGLSVAFPPDQATDSGQAGTGPVTA
jgi:hypothetical protein